MTGHRGDLRTPEPRTLPERGVCPGDRRGRSTPSPARGYTGDSPPFVNAVEGGTVTPPRVVGRAGQDVAVRAVGCRPKGITGSPRRPLPGFEGAESLASPWVIPRVSWLVSHNHADSRLICMTGSRGRPGLLSARRGERSEPERALNRDGGRIDMLAGRKGPLGVWSPPSFPPVLNGYTSIEARTTSTGEGKNS